MRSETCPFLFGNHTFARLVNDFIDGRPQVRAVKSKQGYRLAPGAFRAWMIARSRRRLDENAVKAWLVDRTLTATVHVVAIQANTVALFVDFLVSRGLVSRNPFRELKLKHRAWGMRGIVRHLSKYRSTGSLDAVANVPFSGPLASHFQAYLNQRRALGVSGGSHEVYLASFERFLRERQINELTSITQALVDEWSRWQGTTTEHNNRYRFLIIGKFFDFLTSQGVIERSPLVELMRHRRFSLPPHIYSREDVRLILCAAANLPDHRLMPYRGPTYRLYFLVLYALGLRRTEALDLRVGDIDFQRQALTVRDGKFHKGRVLPFGPKLGASLEQHLKGHPLLRTASCEDFLFPTASHRTTRLSRQTVALTLETLLATLQITAQEGARPPGLHSFRHSFAVHRIERWHREGADIGAKLPLLSTFLGHVDIASTQVYLTMTPERLRLVGESFERMFGTGAAPAGRNQP